jgi:uncharacterized RDD family membrane protein YckC
MSTNEPPAGAPGEPTPPPPAAPDAGSGAPPPPPPAPTPPPTTSAPPPPAAAPVQGVPRPGELLDRFLARFIDGIIVGVVVVIINVVLAGLSDSWLLTNAVSALVSAILYVGYFAYFESDRGQTIGKQVMKLKVFGPDGASNPTMEQAVRRNIWAGFGIAGVIPVLGALLGGLAQLAAVIMIAVNINADPVKRQHWFDKFAGGTQVMKIG